MLTSFDRRRIEKWNSTWRPYPRDLHVPDLVRACAIETPDAPAVVTDTRTLTYRELDARANQLAAQLRALGAGPEVVVGLSTGRSPEMIVGALAILKAGAAYLPLDVSYPPDRLAFILDDARCSLLLSSAGQGRHLAKSVEHIVAIDLSGSSCSSPPQSGLSGSSLAYVLYTSGSTGRPKGVEVTHESLLNLVFWHQRAFDVSPSDRTTQIAAIGFDAAVWEIWPYLASGATVHLPHDEVRSDPEALRDWLLSRRITIMFAPTPMAEHLIALRWPAAASLRPMLTGGDTLHRYPPPSLPFRLINNYGPTECTVVATSSPVPIYEQPDRQPPIGRPIDNTQIHILDEQMREVSLGAEGELYIGGMGLARGYRNQPELTASRFVPSPFDAQPGARLYRTGDRGRYLPDGQIAFLGRVDDQIKIRGYRIEPNEIVAVLSQHPEIEAARVVATDLGATDKRLVAYVVPAAGAWPTPRELQELLRTRLPDYMVPPIFVALGALPLGPNGKVDCGALPEPSPANTLRDTDFEQPRTEVESYVAALVRQLLGLERVGVDDNFFLLGGHSLAGTQLIARIGDTFGVEMSLRAIFDAPTVAQLSAEIERRLVEKLSSMTEDDVARQLTRASLALAP